jgi:hypothetical protein
MVYSAEVIEFARSHGGIKRLPPGPVIPMSWHVTLGAKATEAEVIGEWCRCSAMPWADEDFRLNGAAPHEIPKKFARSALRSNRNEGPRHGRPPGPQFLQP